MTVIHSDQSLVLCAPDVRDTKREGRRDTPAALLESLVDSHLSSTYTRSVYVISLNRSR